MSAIMKKTKFNISRKQARQIAFAIIADIEDYVEKHYPAYEDFLATEESKKGGENHATNEK